MADPRHRRGPSYPRSGNASGTDAEVYELDLFTVLTGLGSGLHGDLTPVSDEGQYALANALVQDATAQGWSFAGTTTQGLYDAVRSSRRRLASPMALVPVDIADPEILCELGVDPNGPTELDALIAAGSAVTVMAGLALLASTGAESRRRDGTRSVRIPLPGQK
jgi:hypothetical protein